MKTIYNERGDFHYIGENGFESFSKYDPDTNYPISMIEYQNGSY